MRKVALTSLLSLVPLLPLLHAQGAASQEVAFLHVNVVPMDRERVLADQTVVVRGQRIVALGPASRIKVPDGAQRIDGRGRYLMPGLAEMHGHIPPGNAPDAEIEKVLAYYALNGITTVRGMLGAPRHLGFRDRANRGELLSPTILTTGPSLNGTSIPTPDSAIRAVTQQKVAGYDLLKIHPGIRREVYDSMAAAARRLQIRFVGHVPLDVGVRRALAAGQWTVDHLDGYVEGLVRDNAPVPATSSQFFGFTLRDQLDETKLAELVRLTRAAGAAVVPTQSLFESMLGDASPEELAARPEMRYWPARVVAQWRQNTENTRRDVGFTPESGRRFLELRRRILKALAQGGVPLLLGSDAPQWWNVPGFSIERELDAMVKAGFTPFEALAMGTRNVAAHLGGPDEFGTVAAGRRADLVLLEGNPLESVAQWSRRAGVMVRGRWYDRDAIARRLDELSR